ncbi:MAG: mercury(II) reductase, partial [Firmicutes bacterium]|nr:mercury(II) reductase [Bacillota bacterium]
MSKVRLTVAGMTCVDCERHVARALEQAGASEVHVDHVQGEALCELGGATVETLVASVRRVGYDPRSVEPLGAATSENHYDLVIIGSGGAAFAAAIEGSRHGARVALVERGVVGGTCVNVGCVPSKMMLAAARQFHQARHPAFAGIGTMTGDVDLPALMAHKERLVTDMRQHKYEDLLKEYGFHLVRGEAQFCDERTIRVADQTITAERFLIATGASPAVPDIPGLRDAGYLTSTEALSLTSVPPRLAVIGSGYVALELGQMFARLGSRVTLMQRGPRLLREQEPEVSKALEGALVAEGITCLHDVRYESVSLSGGIRTIRCSVAGEAVAVEADAVLVAVGRTPNTERLCLERAGVAVGPRREVIVSDTMQTSNPRIYAAGDVVLGPQFVYVAAYEGSLAARNALVNAQQCADLRALPTVTFTDPAVASVGLTQAQAQSRGIATITSTIGMNAVPRAIVEGETMGLIKLVAAADTRVIIGAHIVSPAAG